MAGDSFFGPGSGQDSALPTADQLDQLLRSIGLKAGYGYLKTAITGAVYGLNTVGGLLPLPHNTDNHGYVFFVRPRLNLSDTNIAIERSFVPMLTDDPAVSPKMWRAVRAYLDPVGSRGIRFNAYPSGDDKASSRQSPGTSYGGYGGPGLSYPSHLVDPANAFISILTNTCLTAGGWPDSQLDTYKTRPGIYNESLSYMDSFAKNYGVYDVQTTFQNFTGDMLGYLFHVWTQYACFVKEGRLDPWPDSILEHEIDYNTRIYRLIMDPQRRYVQRIYACGAAFPKTNPNGGQADYDVEKPYNPNIDRINITFECNGFEPYDPIYLYEFNATVIIFNPSMGDERRSMDMTKLRRSEIPVFRCMRVYPRINPDTMELEWWTPNDVYAALSAVANLTGPISLLPDLVQPAN